MHMLWFPQRMLGEGARVQTKAAAAADADLLIEGVILAPEGECPSCKQPLPLAKMKMVKLLLIVQTPIVTVVV